MYTEINSVAKAMNILELFSGNNGGLTLGSIAVSLKLHKSTVNNLVSTLKIHGFLKQRTIRGEYFLGDKFLDTARSMKNNRGERLMVSYLTELSRLVNESVYLEIWYGNDVPLTKALDFLTSPSSMKPDDWPTKPLHITCVGKIILANLSDADLDKYFYCRHLEKLTPDMMTNIEQLKAQLLTVKREGVAFENGESMVGVSGIAAGIKNSDGETIGCVFIMGPSERLTEADLSKITPSIKACAMKISRTLGPKDSKDTIRTHIDKAIESETAVKDLEVKINKSLIQDFSQRTNVVNAVAKAMNILELFSGNSDGLTLGDIAAALDLNKSTVSHLVSTLSIHGFLKQRTRRGKYFLGIRFLDIAGDIQNDCNDGSMVSCLTELSRMANEAVCLEVWYGSNVLLTKAEDYYNNLSDINLSNWPTRPLHITCVGKIILANLSDEDLDKYFRYRHLEKLTPDMMTNIEQLKAQLLTVRREGVAYEHEESMVGVSGIAAEIKNSDGETIGCIFISGPTEFLPLAKLKKITPNIKACAMNISKNPGLIDSKVTTGTHSNN
jgi:IclR family transcriptional regulator, KDG regulon repressor